MDNTTKQTFDEYFISLKTFLDYMYMLGSESITDEQLEALYDTHITISHQDHTINIPFDATAYNCLTNFIETLIKEY
jgi:hypothetical protein